MAAAAAEAAARAKGKRKIYLYWCKTCTEYFEAHIDKNQALHQECGRLAFRECECGGIPGHVPNGTGCRKRLKK